MGDESTELEQRQCALESCGKLFQPRVHNQRFCARECTRIFTNARILAQYHMKKRRVMTGRVCRSKACGTRLSRYNESDICASCENKEHVQKLKDWGWTVEEDGY